MSYCELCGIQITGETYKVVVEDLVISVCRQCSKHGKPYSVPKVSKGKRASMLAKKMFNFDLPTVKDDYSKLIKDAREKLGLTQDDLGNKILERGSVIKLLEQGKFKPDQALARKLERSLGISLFEDSGSNGE